MTIRRDRNRHARRAALDVAAGYQCPDCDADTRLAEQAPGVFVLVIKHDETCPAYRSMSGDLS